MNSWIARLESSKILSSGEVISFREDGSLFVAAVSCEDRVFVVNCDDPTLLHAWGTVTGLCHEERLVIGDDEEANSPPYPTYEVASVHVLLKQTFGLPLSLSGYLSASDFKEYEDGYGNRYGGLVVEVPTALAAKLSEAIRIHIDNTDMFPAPSPLNPAPAPRVFVSYSHDSDSHKAWVRKLSEVLRRNGIDVILDQWDLSLGSDLTRFMEFGLADSDRVLLICTANYVKKANGGAGYEKMIASAEIFRDQATDKFIPVVRGDHVPKLPSFLSSRVYIDFSNDHMFDARCDELLRELHRSPPFPKPALGKNPFAFLSRRDGLERVPLQVDRNGAPRDLSEDFVRYIRLRKRECGSLFFDIDIDKDALALTIPMPCLAHEAIERSSDIVRLLDELRAVPAKTPEQYRLYIALSEIEDPAARIQHKIATGLLELFLDDTIAEWVTSDGDMMLAIQGYIARFFSMSNQRSFVTLWNEESPPQRIRIPLPREQVSFFRTKGSGTWSDFNHDLLMSAVIPGILFAAVHLRQWSNDGSLPKNVSDPRKWTWSDFHEAA